MKSAVSVAVIGLTLGVLVSGCGSAPVKGELPEMSKVERSQLRFALGSRGHLFAAGKLEKNANCKDLRKAIRFEVRRIDRSEKVPVEFSCLFLPGQVAMHTPVLDKGEYELTFSQDASVKGLRGPVQVSVRYRDPDFASGADQDFGGAVELAENQTTKATVNYAAGDRVDWIKVKGKEGRLSLTLREDRDSGPVASAQVYRMIAGKAQPTKAGVLAAGKSRTFDLTPSEDLLVEIAAPNYAGESAYSLTRRELTASAKRVALSVVDCYPVTESSSIVLLRASEGLKQDDGVEVFGIDVHGKRNRLGQCKVESLAEGQASCRLGRSVPRDVVEYRAEAILGGKS